MVNWIRIIYPCGLNKGFSSKFHVGSIVRQETPEEGQRMHRPTHCEYSNKDEDNSLNTLNDKNYQDSFQKFRQLKKLFVSSLNIKSNLSIKFKEFETFPLPCNSNKWNHLTLCKKMSSGLFKNVIYKMCLEIIYSIYMYKKYLALNNLQWLICHKTKPCNPRGNNFSGVATIFLTMTNFPFWIIILPPPQKKWGK